MIRNCIYNNKIMLTIGTVLILSISIIGSIAVVKADESVQYNKSFISIEIESGDTLSSIAEEYAIMDTEYDDYIQEVRNINNLSSDTIHSGCYLMVPVYEVVSSK
ncbi:MAG: LysM peptidoglycan-binding domain-containing protein [Lachnospiraceae bacterium]|nr:LysM peptidoglycan-binding domain-containing protein [Lachnospiraceae bacterium]